MATITLKVESDTYGVIEETLTLNDEVGTLFVGHAMSVYPTHKEGNDEDVQNTPEEAIRARLQGIKQASINDAIRWGKDKAVADAMAAYQEPEV